MPVLAGHVDVDAIDAGAWTCRADRDRDRRGRRREADRPAARRQTDARFDWLDDCRGATRVDHDLPGMKTVWHPIRCSRPPFGDLRTGIWRRLEHDDPDPRVEERDAHDHQAEKRRSSTGPRDHRRWTSSRRRRSSIPVPMVQEDDDDPTMLDLIRPTSGIARVFGIESSADPVAIHRRIGYLPGEFTLYDRLTGAQTLEYFANLRGGVDRAYQASLTERFDLDTSRRFKEYSKGNKQKVGLVIALQHRPELLLLDEPTAGLDPLIQQSFFQALRELIAEGRTAFLSSHILSEVEKSCDRVAIIREVAWWSAPSRRCATWHHQVELRFTGPVPLAEFARLPGVSDVVGDDRAWMRVSGDHAGRPGGGPHEPDFVSRGRASRRHSWRSTVARPSR